MFPDSKKQLKKEKNLSLYLQVIYEATAPELVILLWLCGQPPGWTDRREEPPPCTGGTRRLALVCMWSYPDHDLLSPFIHDLSLGHITVLISGLTLAPPTKMKQKARFTFHP